MEFEETMKAEHCSMGGYDHRFVTGNTGRCTWPANEWAITFCGDYTHLAPSSSRILKTITVLMEQDVVKQAALTRHEVTAVVLYTGPMVSTIQLENHCRFQSIFVSLRRVLKAAWFATAACLVQCCAAPISTR